jgi:tripeptide aminopeptidase
MDIDRERLALTFIQLCETDSPSRSEGRMAALLTEMLCELGLKPPFEDDSAARTGSECGNLFFRIRGGLDREPLFFNCHLDTVEPGTGIKVVRRDDLFTSLGNTVLGSDDKAGIAALVEALRVIREHDLPHIPMEYVFTTCEEIGLLGAKALNPTHIRAKMGYALDSSGFGRVIIGAPASNRLKITIQGIAAHAGLHPERGINAITLAGKALAKAPLGRIDEESTVNFGTIQGGAASNIVPEQVIIEGEVRSHSPKKLNQLTREIEQVFHTTIEDWEDPFGEANGLPKLDFRATPDFSVMQLSTQDTVIRLIDQAAATIGMELSYEVAGGGSDANIFNGYGLQTAIVATGMTHVHSMDEQVRLQDMVDLTRLLLALIT